MAVSEEFKAKKVQEIHDFVKLYMLQFNKPIPLFILNRRFGVKFKMAMGRSIREVIEEDKRFIPVLLETGATAVAVEAGF